MHQIDGPKLTSFEVKRIVLCKTDDRLRTRENGPKPIFAAPRLARQLHSRGSSSLQGVHRRGGNNNGKCHFRFDVLRSARGWCRNNSKMFVCSSFGLELWILHQVAQYDLPQDCLGKLLTMKSTHWHNLWHRAGKENTFLIRCWESAKYWVFLLPDFSEISFA